MNSFVLFLRGINVGGSKKILMKDLKDLLESLGFFNVKTYIQSGNVWLDSNDTDIQVLESKVEKGILDKYGFDVPAFVLPQESIFSILENDPYKEEDITKRYYALLSQEPIGEVISKLNEYDFGKDQWTKLGNVIYILVDDKYSQSKLTHTLLEKVLKVKVTVRNFKTVTKMNSL